LKSVKGQWRWRGGRYAVKAREGFGGAPTPPFPVPRSPRSPHDLVLLEGAVEANGDGVGADDLAAAGGGAWTRWGVP